MLVTEEDGASYSLRLAHPLFAEAIRTDIPVSLLRQIHLDLADELSQGPRQGRQDPLRLAVLREAAGETADPLLLVAAAARANLLSDYRLAERLATAAIGQETSAVATLELGRALLGQNRHEDAEAVLRPLIGHAPNDEFRAQLLDVLTRAMHQDVSRERVDEVLAICETLARDVTDVRIKSFIECHRATVLALSGQFAEAIEIGLKGLDSVEDDVVAVRAVAPVVASLTMDGRIDEARSIAERSMERALRVQDRLPRAPTMVVFPLITALFFGGRFEEALGLIDIGLKSARHVSGSVLADANGFQGRFHLSLGRPRTAARLCRDANATLRHYADTVEPAWCMAIEAEAHAPSRRTPAR